MKRVVVGKAELIPFPRQVFPTRTIFPKMFPVPVVCSDFCGKVDRCNLRENGFSDLCKYRHKLGKLVMPVDLRWSVRFNMKKDLEKGPGEGDCWEKIRGFKACSGWLFDIRILPVSSFIEQEKLSSKSSLE
jgi:hypothetical protein